MYQRKSECVVAVHGAGSVLPAGALWTDVNRAETDANADNQRRLRDNFLAEGTGLSRRDLKKIDRMAMLALFAARSAIEEAALSEDEIAGCGILTGNAVAGWSFTEPQLRSLYQNGLSNISPYLASAWFPAASQGQIAIHMHLLGYAKTVTTDRCAGTQAIGMAYDAVRAGRATHLLAGAAEAPVTPFVEGAARHAGAPDINLIEGAAYLVLGESMARRAAIAELADHSSFTLPSAMSDRLALCAKQLMRLYQRNCEVGQLVDLMIDSRQSADRELVTILRERGWLGEAHFNGTINGDALAATGPTAAVTLCRRYITTSYRLPAIVFSLGRDFASAILLRPPH
ncbi:beta-ketoacyl synthase N-terminal-like domain-containing protein [Bradyrhizobium tropiciagri]|uniref:beta-ketoacyl synthase N-terminal-like domain-containing protein n=1 Tax=Bradyrhizobium tropiciagri TaxID=312253 RepID=UPI00067A7992|nr:beta-ketoacyl synthase N-terminal-like domain-containing protein [Bradyrhizobium tropiciagri]